MEGQGLLLTFIDDLFLSKCHSHSLHFLADEVGGRLFETVRNQETCLSCVACYHTIVFLRLLHLLILPQRSQQIQIPNEHKQHIFRHILRESLEKVRNLQLHTRFLHQRKFQYPLGGWQQQNATKYEIIGDLHRQYTRMQVHLHQRVQDEFIEPRFTHDGVDGLGDLIVLAGEGGEEGDGEEGAAVVGVVGVVGDGEQQFGGEVGEELLTVGFQQSAHGLEGVFEVEVAAFGDDPLSAVLEHLIAAVARLGKDVDQPRPLLVLAHLPGDFGEHLRDDLAVDYEVAEEGEGVGVVAADEGEQLVEVGQGEGVGGDLKEGVEELVVAGTQGFVASLLHQRVNLLLPELNSPLPQFLTTFPHHQIILHIAPFSPTSRPAPALPFLQATDCPPPVPQSPSKYQSSFRGMISITVSYFGMNFFLKGDFKLNQNCDPRPGSRQALSRQKSRGKDSNRSLVNAGRNMLAEPISIPDILDTETSKRILREFAAEIPPPASIKSEKKISSKEESLRLPPRQKVSLPAADGDLLTSMANRLKTVEMTCKNQREEIRVQTQAVEKLRAENAFLKSFREDSTKEYEKMKALQAENAQLKKKSDEMQAYLKKYGLKWVGDKLEGKLQAEKMKKAIAKGNYQYRLPSEIDINTIAQRIHELNGGLHSEGKGTEIYQENGVHKFRQAEPLPIGFFANGIAIKGYKFFPYKSKESLQILGDLIDGYFPYVLKAKYPNGVFLKVVDKLVERYDDEASSESICTFESNESKDFKPPTKEEFLMKLPKSIVKNGKVISIRDEISKKLNGDNAIVEQPQEEDNDIFEKSQGLTVFKTEAHLKVQHKVKEESEICTLKIRNEQGEVFILQLQKHELMSEVYKWMRKVTKGSFKVMSNFPRRAYEPQQKDSLQDLGFFPNAMLHIQSTPQ